jgi:hypothetical protein
MTSSSIKYPPGPHSILPEKLLREFMHDPIKTLMNIAHMYGDIAHFKFGRQHVYLFSATPKAECKEWQPLVIL